MMACKICHKLFNRLTINYTLSDCEKLSNHSSQYFFSEIFSHDTLDWGLLNQIQLIPFCVDCVKFIKTVSDRHQEIVKIKEGIDDSIANFTLGILRSRRAAAATINSNNCAYNTNIHSASASTHSANTNVNTSISDLSPREQLQGGHFNVQNIKIEKVETVEQKFGPSSTLSLIPSTFTDTPPEAFSSSIVKVEEPCADTFNDNELPNITATAANTKMNSCQESQQVLANVENDDSDDDCMILEEKLVEVVHLERNILKPRMSSSLKINMTHFPRPWSSSTTSLGIPVAKLPVTPFSGLEVSRANQIYGERENNLTICQGPPENIQKLPAESESVPVVNMPTAASKQKISFNFKNNTSRKRWFCSECRIRFLRRDDLRHHQNEVHVTKKLIQCPKCPKKFQRQGSLTKHIRGHALNRNSSTNKRQVPTTKNTVGIKQKIGMKNRTVESYRLKLEAARQYLIRTRCTLRTAAEKFKVNRSTLSVYKYRIEKKSTFKQTAKETENTVIPVDASAISCSATVNLSNNSHNQSNNCNKVYLNLAKRKYGTATSMTKLHKQIRRGKKMPYDYQLRLEKARQLFLTTGCTKRSAAEKFRVKRSTLSSYIIRKSGLIKWKPSKNETDSSKTCKDADATIQPSSSTVLPENNSSAKSITSPVGLFKCKDCHTQFTKERQLMSHICPGGEKDSDEKELEGLFYCTHCRKAFLTKGGLATHRKNFHQVRPPGTPSKFITNQEALDATDTFTLNMPTDQPSNNKKNPTGIPDRYKDAVALVISGNATIPEATAKYNLDRSALYPYLNVEKTYVLKDSVDPLLLEFNPASE